MNLRLQCQCGALHGQLSQTHLGIRGVCYCKDCRAYSHHLGKETAAHDALGGVEFVATQVQYVTLAGGTEHLACLSLSENGLLRWYAKCCNTPIANTSRNWKFPYVGLIHTCLKSDPAAYERSFPRIEMRVNTGAARERPPGMLFGTIVSLMGFMPRVMVNGLMGAYKRTPFFDPSSGAPNAAISVLSNEERKRAYAD